jgi:hypothetical protein
MANVLQRQASVVPVLLGSCPCRALNYYYLYNSSPPVVVDSAARPSIRSSPSATPSELVMVGAGEQRAAAVT